MIELIHSTNRGYRMARKLFCEISPLTYKISTQKEILKRNIKDKKANVNFATEKSENLLPVVVYSHKSLIRRKLGNVDMTLQNNKAINLAIAAPKVDKVIIKPGQVFSFWHLVGKVSEKQGYKTGLTIKSGNPSSDIGGGMCQFTNLIHWLVLHSPLTICEHHHHDGVDLFPDFGRVVPFGTGTSILYNYKDYRFINNTSYTFQLAVHTDGEYLIGHLLCSDNLPNTYDVKAEEEFFSQEDGAVYRNNKVYRKTIDVITGNIIEKQLIKTNHAKVMYDTSNLEIRENEK